MNEKKSISDFVTGNYCEIIRMAVEFDKNPTPELQLATVTAATAFFDVCNTIFDDPEAKLIDVLLIRAAITCIDRHVQLIMNWEPDNPDIIVDTEKIASLLHIEQ